MITETTRSGLKRSDFYELLDGKQVDLFVMENAQGVEVAVTNYGCAILTWLTPDKAGRFANIIQGHDSLAHLLTSKVGCLSTTIGRYGNRIADGKFTLEGTEYTLEQNNGKNSLHGGVRGFHKRVWDVVAHTEKRVAFHYTAADGEEGFPGEMQVEMSYELTDDGSLVIDYRATTNQTTIVNLTHHAFFSLTGIGNPTPSAMGNIVVIDADHYLPTDETSIPTGEVLSVKGTPMDFLAPHAVGERIEADFQPLQYGHGYDHCYVLNKSEAGALNFAAYCLEPQSGRTLEVFTTEPGLQFYTANWNGGMTGAFGATFPDRSALCFEAQHFPDTPNKGHFPSCILRPGEEYTQTTIYKIAVKQ